MAQMSADVLYNPIHDEQFEEETLERTPSGGGSVSFRYSDGSISGKNSGAASLLKYSDGSYTAPNTEGLSILPPQVSKTEKITRYAFCFSFTIIVALAIYIAFAALYHSYVYTTYSPASYVYNYNPSLGSADAQPAGTIFAASEAEGFGTAANPIKVTLIGDSLIGKTWDFRNLNGKLQERISKHTDLHFQFFNHGSNGDTIRNIGKRIVPSVLADQSSIVIVNWDSDATDSDTIDMSAEQYDQFKVRYVQSLNWALANVTALPQVQFVAIAGPSLYGEGPVFKPSRFTPDKGKVLSQFRQLNIDASKRFQISYIDMHEALESVSVPWWGLYRFWCTQDGEHYSELGASIEADNFVQFLRY